VHLVHGQHGITQEIEGFEFFLNDRKLETKIRGSGSGSV